MVPPVPEGGGAYSYWDGGAPVIQRAYYGGEHCTVIHSLHCTVLHSLHCTAGEDLELTLPCNLTVESLSWISLWCRLYGVDFGSLTIPQVFRFLAVQNSVYL